MPKQARQLNLSISAPPTRGAQHTPTLWDALARLSHSDLLWEGKRWVIRMMTPLPTPLIPKPAVARPTMNIFDVYANVQMMDPSVKMTMPASTMALGAKMVQALPKLACPD